MSLKEIRCALTELPKDLDEMYERILQKIPGKHRGKVNCVLHMLVVSFRPLKLHEVAEAIAVDCENNIFDLADRLLDQHDILKICSSLVTWSGYYGPPATFEVNV